MDLSQPRNSSELPDLRLINLGHPIDLDNHAGSEAVREVVNGTLVGVWHYLDDDDTPRTRVSVRVFGGHVLELEFLDGDFSQPAPPLPREEDA